MRNRAFCDIKYRGRMILRASIAGTIRVHFNYNFNHNYDMMNV